ncbi:MAG: radical SAM protein [Candidatus Wallbacteria bacterium]|nr:radical SAM protein [Candidatus Wallbacteria bacterium]
MKENHFIDYSRCFLSLELSSFCNLSCDFCSQHNHAIRDKSFMQFSLFRRIIDELAEKQLTLKSINPFFRGESLLHPDFCAMLDYIYEKSSVKPVAEYIVLHTNGLLFDNDKIESLLRVSDQKRLPHPGNLILSMDAATEKTYRLIRKGEFGILVGNIRALLERRRELSQWGPNVVFQFIVMEDNYTEVKEFESLIRSLCTQSGHKEPVVRFSPDNQPLEFTGDTIYFRMQEADPCRQEQLRELYLRVKG